MHASIVTNYNEKGVGAILLLILVFPLNIDIQSDYNPYLVSM